MGALHFETCATHHIPQIACSEVPPVSNVPVKRTERPTRNGHDQLAPRRHVGHAASQQLLRLIHMFQNLGCDSVRGSEVQVIGAGWWQQQVSLSKNSGRRSLGGFGDARRAQIDAQKFSARE